MASRSSRLAVYLGLSRGEPQPGYRMSGDWRYRYPVCERCGARVNPSEMPLHSDWHARLGA